MIFILGKFFEDAQDIGEEEMLYGHSDIKLYGAIDTRYKDNTDILKKVNWFSGYEIALHTAKKNCCGCVVEIVVNADDMLDLLNKSDIRYVNRYYKWLKGTKSIKGKIVIETVIGHLLNSTDNKFKLIRSIEENKSKVDTDNIIHERLEVFKIIDTSIIKNKAYKDIK